MPVPFAASALWPAATAPTYSRDVEAAITPPAIPSHRAAFAVRLPHPKETAPRKPPMSLSMYDLSVPVLQRGLGVLSNYLDKASAYATERGIDPTVLINARLAPDMLPLAGQVQRASDGAKGVGARLTGADAPSFPDTETTFAGLGERVAKTVAYLQTITPQSLEGSDARPITLKFGSQSVTLRGDAYLTGFALPNFFFHVTTAHNILRHNGLAIGKKDYLGNFA
jgi:uncharacterized protein